MADESYAFPVVGIGASAGGISALEEFFKGMPEVSLDLRAALREAVATRSPVTHESLLVNDENERAQPLHLTIEPLHDTDFYLVVIQPAGSSRSLAEHERVTANGNGSAEVETERRPTRERLQSMIAEYESAMDELKSSNEELISVNEELNTINLELNSKMEQLHRVNTDLNNLFESTPIATVFLDGNLLIRSFTPAALRFFNLREADIGRPLTDLSNRLGYPELEEHLHQAYASDEVIERKLPRDSEGKHHLIRLVPYRDNSGRREGIVLTLLDVTTLADSEERQKILVSELNHRVKNMLSVVISFANHALDAAGTSDGEVRALVGRLQSMSRAYALLAKTDWKYVPLDEIVRQEATQYGIGRFKIDGPDIRLRPQLGLSIASVIHELSTNAMKHGALREPNGLIEISWRADGDALELAWQETGGPAPGEPDAEGFGLTLVRGEIEYRLGGTVQTDFGRAGLSVTLNLTLAP